LEFGNPGWVWVIILVKQKLAGEYPKPDPLKALTRVIELCLGQLLNISSLNLSFLKSEEE
jgi:hypothetical protein